MTKFQRVIIPAECEESLGFLATLEMTEQEKLAVILNITSVVIPNECEESSKDFPLEMTE